MGERKEDREEINEREGRKESKERNGRKEREEMKERKERNLINTVTSYLTARTEIEFCF